MKTYTEKDFVDVVDEAGEPAGSYPKAWQGTEFWPDGVKPAGRTSSRQSAPAPDAPVEIPEGDPSDDWKVPQIDAYAAREGIDLGDAKNKADKLAAIATSKAGAGDPSAPNGQQNPPAGN